MCRTLLPPYPKLEAAEVSLGEKQRPKKGTEWKPTTAFMPSAPGLLLHLLLDADGSLLHETRSKPLSQGQMPSPPEEL